MSDEIAQGGVEQFDRTESVLHAADGARQAAESAAHGAPILDVLGDTTHEQYESEDDQIAPPPPTGDSFGVSTPVRPPGLSRKTIGIAATVFIGFMFLLFVGIMFGIESKASSGRAVPMGDSLKRKPFSQSAGGGVVSADAFATPMPNGTPYPTNPYARVQQQQAPYSTQYGTPQQQQCVMPDGAGGFKSCPNVARTPVPSVVLSRGGPNCVVQPGYAGPVQPGCPPQQRTPYGTQPGTTQTGTYAGGGAYTQQTPSPAEIAAQRQREQEIADAQSAAQASAFVNDTQPGSPQSNAAAQASATAAAQQGGVVNPQGLAAQQQIAAQQYAAQQRQPQSYGTPAPTPPPPNYLNVGIGTWLPITTMGSIDCAVPGFVTAQVREPVADVNGSYTLIPQFSKVIGQTINSTQGHCDIAWTTLRLPNGNEIALRSYRSQDSHGQSGIGGTVDDHRWSIARTGLFSAAVAAAAGYAITKAQQPQGGSVIVVTQTSPSQQAVTAAIGPIQSAADRIIGLDASRPADVRVPDGTHLNLYVDSPIYLPPWQP